MSSVAEKVVTAIASGKLDSSLHIIRAALVQRMQSIDQIKAASLQVGDRVVFNHRVKPRYLRGVRGKIVSVDHNTEFSFRVDIHRKLNRYGPIVGATSGIIDKEE